MTTPTDAKMALTFHFVLASFLFGSAAYADEAPPPVVPHLPGDVEFMSSATQPCAWVLGNDMKWKEVNCIEAASSLAAAMMLAQLAPSGAGQIVQGMAVGCEGNGPCPPKPIADGYQDFTVPKPPRCDPGWMLVYFPHSEIQMCARELRAPND